MNAAQASPVSSEAGSEQDKPELGGLQLGPLRCPHTHREAKHSHRDRNQVTAAMTRHLAPAQGTRHQSLRTRRVDDGIRIPVIVSQHQCGTHIRARTHTHTHTHSLFFAGLDQLGHGFQHQLSIPAGQGHAAWEAAELSPVVALAGVTRQQGVEWTNKPLQVCDRFIQTGGTIFQPRWVCHPRGAVHSARAPGGICR